MKKRFGKAKGQPEANVRLAPSPSLRQKKWLSETAAMRSLQKQSPI